ncbi:MAG: hypothetical protein ABIQ31_05770 [Ferruginibacter sp.]
MKIIANTTFTPYNKDSIIKPTHPVWILKNTGFYDCFVNDSIRLGPGDFFGIDSLPLLIPIIQNELKNGKKINLINETQFTVSFGAYATGLTYSQVTLIETSYSIIK